MFDDKFVDVDFTKDPNYAGGFSGMGSMNVCMNVGDSVQIINEGDWPALMAKQELEKTSLDYLVTRIYNQKNEGSCVANATSQSHEIVQARQFGKPNVIHLSAMSLYKRIGSSPGSGAMVSDGIMEMKDRGILPLDNEQNRVRFGDKVMPNTGWSTPYPSDWQPTAKHFRCTEFFSVRGTKQLVTCLLLNMPVVVGRQGHSICYVRAFIKDGRLYVKYVNSWGEWGVAGGDLPSGFGIDSEGTIAQAAQEAFAIRAVVMP